MKEIKTLEKKCPLLVTDHCQIEVYILEEKKTSIVTIDTSKFKNQHLIIGKQVGDTYRLPNIPLTYRIESILSCLSSSMSSVAVSNLHYRKSFARTNAQFLNEIFGTNYNQYFKSTWRYNSTIDIWMVPFNTCRDGFSNYIMNGGEEIIEICYEAAKRKLFPHSYMRVAVKKDNGYFSILGLYRYCPEKSDLKTHVYKKVPLEEAYRFVPVIFEET